MIATLLGWTKFPQWALELIVLAAVAGGIWYVLHERYEAGISAQVAKDTADSDALKAKTAKETAALQTKATTAKDAYDKEHQDNVDYRHDHPDAQPVRLCLSPTPLSSIVSSIAAAHAGDANSGAAKTNVPAVPDGNSSGGSGAAGPDISTLLGLLAVKADNVSATLREFQAR